VVALSALAGRSIGMVRTERGDSMFAGSVAVGGDAAGVAGAADVTVGAVGDAWRWIWDWGWV